MPKFNNLLLTFVLALFTLFLCESEVHFDLKKDTQKHEIKIDNTFNALAISINNSFHELLNLDNQKEPTAQNNYYTKNSLDKLVFKEELQYLKICDLINLKLSPQNIIYPFHSFL